MRFVPSSFYPWSRAFVGINNTSLRCLAFPNIEVGFHTALYRYFARHCCWHRNFQLSTSGFHCELEFFVVWLNDEYFPQLTGIVELRFLDSPSCFAFFFAASDMNVHILGHTSSGREVVCFLVSLLPGTCLSFRWPFLQ